MIQTANVMKSRLGDLTISRMHSTISWCDFLYPLWRISGAGGTDLLGDLLKIQTGW